MGRGMSLRAQDIPPVVSGLTAPLLYRWKVREFCDVRCGLFTYYVIAGRTGSAKGKLLNAITAAGGQVRRQGGR